MQEKSQWTLPLRESKAMILPRMPEEGIEPTLSCENWILSPARLPVPPLRRLSKHELYAKNQAMKSAPRAALIIALLILHGM